MLFEDKEHSRTQEFVLRWSSDRGRLGEIVRQQWNFSAPDSVWEIEDYAVNLCEATLLELTIVPDIGGGEARASLGSLRLA